MLNLFFCCCNSVFFFFYLRTVFEPELKSICKKFCFELQDLSFSALNSCMDILLKLFIWFIQKKAEAVKPDRLRMFKLVKKKKKKK